VVQEQQKVAERQQETISALSAKVSELERELRLKGASTNVNYPLTFK
jgi:hypothetical protein